MEGESPNYIFYPTIEEMKNVVEYISTIEKEFDLKKVGFEKIVLPEEFVPRSGYDIEDFEF